ncbi:GIY-YIG nuclease family protein [Taibaiella koreensis]|uniref:hypothetical protein n=1 Tax=Taibaiella koreensis TaxID=1268548 RepID=UPI000E59B8A9|nr:hypothetical protein [Taibaiella koreensis]
MMQIQFQSAYYVYVVTDHHRQSLSVGITTNLAQRRDSLVAGLSHLVYYERYTGAKETILRESRLQCYSQRKLRKLVTRKNPGLLFLDPVGSSELS